MRELALMVAVAVCLGGCPEDTSGLLWGVAVDGGDGVSVGDTVPGLGGPDAAGDSGNTGPGDVALDSATDASAPEDGLADAAGRVDTWLGDVAEDAGGGGPGDAGHLALDGVHDAALDVAEDVTPDATSDALIQGDGIAGDIPLLDTLELDAQLDLGPGEADAGPCTPEGGVLAAGGVGGTCCGAAQPIGCEAPNLLGLCVLPCLGGTVCAQCGDDQCGPGENQCNCPEDCDP